MPLQVEAS